MAAIAATGNIGNEVEVASPSQGFLETAKKDLMDETKRFVVTCVSTYFLTAIN